MITSHLGSYHVACHSSFNIQSYECKTVKWIDDLSLENMYPDETYSGMSLVVHVSANTITLVFVVSLFSTQDQERLKGFRGRKYACMPIQMNC